MVGPSWSPSSYQRHGCSSVPGTRDWGHATVAAVAAFAAGSILLILRGTPWGLEGLIGDMVLRTEAATRFTESVASADFAYRDLPAFYPPLLPWVEGRTAALFGVPGWQMVKGGQIALTLLTPVVAYLLWSRVVKHPQAALVVATTTLFAADVHKVDQWLVLAVLLPWWLDAFRDVRRRGARPWPAWVHGIIAGLALTTYTFYFVPLALATLLGITVDVVRGAPWVGHLRRYVAIVAVGLVVSAWYWLPLMLQRLDGAAVDDVQRRYLGPSWTTTIPVPFSTEPAMPHLSADHLLVALLSGLGVVFMFAMARLSREVEGLLLVATGALVTLAGGLLAAALNRPFLAFKAQELLTHTMLAAGVIGLLWGVERARRRGVAVNGPWTGLRAGAVAVIAIGGSLQYASTWTTGDPVTYAYQQPLPDGSMPGASDTRPMSDPSVVEVREALGQAAQPSAVVLTSEFGLVGTTPLHLFVAWSSINSHPYGQFEERVAFLQGLAAEEDPSRFTSMARGNSFDRIDAFVLKRRGSGFVYRVRVDNYPDLPRALLLRFQPAQFASSDWKIEEMGDLAVVTHR